MGVCAGEVNRSLLILDLKDCRLGEEEKPSAAKHSRVLIFRVQKNRRAEKFIIETDSETM